MRSRPNENRLPNISLGAGGCQSQEAAAAIKLDGTSRQAAALGLLRAVVRGAGPLLSRESWISEQPAQLDSCRASDADMPERAERGVGEGGGESEGKSTWNRDEEREVYLLRVRAAATRYPFDAHRMLIEVNTA